MHTRHALITRLFHASLAIAVVVQLGSSQFMTDHNGGNTLFWVHQYAGLVAFALVLGFWAVAIMRKRGTPLGELLPWFSAPARRAVWADLKLHIIALKNRKIPAAQEPAPLASAVHGLGLLLITGMTITGSYYYFFNTGVDHEGGLVGLAMNAHRLLANLAWAYLIAHAGLAVVNHIAGAISLRTMWSFKAGEK
ncbi:cytochrome b/b6 domain-containing protein [Pseudorhodobacter sp. W20_MBD10_FR17]|uniref:cytochrome b/b6 domain-containing protein n=1 Tax=Pseudorhodobacter sp. W20_MBD10_FR17 TaxID=3240266 RepID=UPI003F9C81C4